MNYKIDPKSESPAYLQLYRLLVRDIVTGVYPAGSKLPSKRTIAAETGVSTVTVEHAIGLICDEGYAQAKERSGVFVTYEEAGTFTEKSPINAAQKTLSPRDTGDFPYSVLARTIRKVLADYGERILVKSPNHGAPELRKEIAAYLARSRAIFVSPAQIIIGSGAEYLYGLIAQLLGRTRVYAVEWPSYDKIRKVYGALGCTCRFLPLSSDGIASNALMETDATVLHVTPFNSFPSGVTVGASKKREYLRWAAQRDGYVIEDNYDSELTVSRKAEDSLFSMAEDARVIYVNTFSKTIAPSMRIGYMILPEGEVGAFHDALGFYSCTVPLFEQYVLAELLRNGDFERHINRERRKRRKESEGGKTCDF